MNNSIPIVLCVLALSGVILNRLIRDRSERRKTELSELRRHLVDLLQKARDGVSSITEPDKEARARRQLNIVEMEIGNADPGTVFGRLPYKKLLEIEEVLLGVTGASTRGLNFKEVQGYVPASVRAQERIDASARRNSRSRVAAQAAALQASRAEQGLGPRKKAGS